MMASRDSATEDDYVAQLLAKEAKDASKKYSELGVRALLPTRPTTAAPKPNTRFLKNIIRETDNHNLALKKKEGLEARSRLRAVNNGGPATSDRHGREDERHRKRRRVDDNEGYDRDRRRKRRSRQHYADDSEERTSGEEEEERRRRTRRHSGERDRNGDVGSRGTRRHYEEQHRSSHREKRSSRLRDLTDQEERSHSHHRKKRRRSSSRPSNTSNEHNHHPHRRKEHGHRTHRERLSPSSDNSRSPRRERRPRRSPTPPDVDVRHATTQKNVTSLAPGPESDSDPLEALVGPLPPTSTSMSVNDPPPTRSRGRGAYKPSASAMDQRFSSTYNPSLDLHPDSEPEDEKEDWDMALEALRDREIWKQKGAERLRAAGFGDEEIKKWKDSGKEKGPEDVKWTEKGEAREWDRGKVIEELGERKGEVGLEAAWKRKGGGFLKDFKKALG